MQDIADKLGVQFGSVWKVVEHATSPDQNRSKIYLAACKAFVKDRRWKDYEAIQHPRFDQIVGYRRLDPRAWFAKNTKTGEVQGPFKTKRAALRPTGVTSAHKTDRPGVYTVDSWVVFTRENASKV